MSWMISWLAGEKITPASPCTVRKITACQMAAVSVQNDVSPAERDDHEQRHRDEEELAAVEAVRERADVHADRAGRAPSG